MPSNTTNLSRCSSYEDAEKLFRDPAPKGRTWGDNERPLGENRQHHYRVARNHDTSYSVMLYKTEMARYHPPVPYGERCINLTWHDTSTTSMFMHQVVREEWCEEAKTSCGRKVWRVLRPGCMNTYTYDYHGRLILAKSQQEAVRRKIVNPAMGEWLAQAKLRLSPLTNLLELRVEQDAADAEADTMDYHEGKAFKGNPRVERLLYKLGQWDPARQEWQPHVEALKDLFAASVRGLVATRERKADGSSRWGGSKGVPYTTPTAKAAMTAFYGHIKKLAPVGDKVTVATDMWPDVDAFAKSAITWY